MKSTYKYLILLLFAFSILKIKGQKNTDSLIHILSNTTSDTVKIKLYNRLSIIFCQTNAPLSKSYADSALTVIAINEPQHKNNSFFYENSKAMAYNNIGSVAFQQGKFNDAVQYCIKALKIYERNGNYKNIARLQNNLGSILKSIGNHKEALYYHRKCAIIKEKFYIKEKGSKSTTFALATCYLNLGSDFGDLQNYDSSFYYLNKSLMLLDTNEKTDNLGLVYIGLAHVNRKLKNYPAAIKFNQSALNVYLNLGIPESTSLAYNGLSELYYELKNYSKALDYLNLAEELNKANSLSDDLLTGYENKAKVYEKLNDTKNEILYLRKHANLKDSLLKENHNIQIIELQTQYETEKKEKEIIKLNKDNKIQELQLEKDSETNKLLTTIIISVVLVLLLLGVLTAFLIKTINERKKAYIKLQGKNIEIQSQSEKLNKQSKLIARYQSQMNPHFIFNALNNIQGFVLNNEKQKTINQLQLFSTLMRQTLNNSESETISLEKEIKYLETYLDFEQQCFENKIEMEISCTENTDEILVPPMMIQPFIENVFKHAGLQSVADAKINLNISTEENLLKIEIKDNGKGLDLSNDSLIKNSHAISIIRSRLQILFQASNLEIKPDYFSIISKPILERGTIIKFYLPLIYKY